MPRFWHRIRSRALPTLRTARTLAQNPPPALPTAISARPMEDGLT